MPTAWCHASRPYCAISGIVILAAFSLSLTGTDYGDVGSMLLNGVISSVSAITGILCVVPATKGKLSSWIYGIVNSVLYGYLAYRTGYHGDAIINDVSIYSYFEQIVDIERESYPISTSAGTYSLTRTVSPHTCS